MDDGDANRMLPALPSNKSGNIILPRIIVSAGEHASRRFLEFFTANIRNRNTRIAYAEAVGQFMAWCEEKHLALVDLEPVAVSAYVEQLMSARSAPTVKQHLAASATAGHAHRSEFARGFTEKPERIPIQNIFPKMSTVVFQTTCAMWRPDRAIAMMDNLYDKPARNPKKRVLMMVTRELDPVPWGKVRGISNTTYELYLLHWDEQTKLLYIHSSNKETIHEGLAKAVCGDDVIPIRGERVYRALHGINRPKSGASLRNSAEANSASCGRLPTTRTHEHPHGNRPFGEAEPNIAASAARNQLLQQPSRASSRPRHRAAEPENALWLSHFLALGRKTYIVRRLIAIARCQQSRRAPHVVCAKMNTHIRRADACPRNPNHRTRSRIASRAVRIARDDAGSRSKSVLRRKR